MAEERGNYFKQIVVGVVLALAVGGSAPWWWAAIFPGSGDGGNSTTITGSPLPCRDASISLSIGSGPSGTHVVVSGRGFPSSEAVEVRFHTEVLPPARTDAAGSFRDEVVIPGTLDAFAPQQFEITATAKPDVCSDSKPFLLTPP